HPLDRHSCLVFNDLKLKLVVSFKASHRLWTGIIGDFIVNVKSVSRELEESCQNVKKQCLFLNYNPFIYIN
ncbi:MAG: hypothetical protein PHQ22_00005, partial [Sulfuricurvum sp.]|nr:hypothetical protein [Sulfuricurvum sp.]